MRKISNVLIALSIMLLCASCGNSTANSVNSSSTIDSSSESEKNITESDAVKIITGIIGNDDGKRIIECEDSYEIDNVEYYFIHAYSVSSEPLDSEGTRMTFTYGWYSVNKANGTAYKNETGVGGELTPMN